MSSLVEVDSVEILVINDNEVDPMSPYTSPGLQVSGQMKDLAMFSPNHVHDRGDAKNELRMESLCCGSHGLSLMVTAVKGDVRHTLLFDTGPEEDGWERNVQRLRPDLSSIEVLHLSHWHRDHSGGMLRAIRMIKAAKERSGTPHSALIADLHPNRPTYRGFMIREPISLEADPAFDEIAEAGASVQKNADAHTVLDDMFLISGMIPRVTPYETGLRNGLRFNSSTNSWEKDELVGDERFVACNVKGKGLVMFTGCSHAGVVNASKHAVTLAGGSVPLYSVIGGYHLGDGDAAKVRDTVRELKSLDPKILLPGHCSGWRVKFEIEREMPGCLAPCTVGTKFTL